jgi:deazaflavin-dependent oxidoreductase (nitroreductase family)
MNRASALQFSAGHLSPTRAVTLEVVGRRSGRTISFPVVVADYQGERYLVSMLGQEANWVRNVRAAGGRAVLRRGGHEAVHLTEVDVGSRAPILRRYLEVAPGARPHVPVDRHAPLEDFEHIAAQFPVFRITTVAAPGRCPRRSGDSTAGDAGPECEVREAYVDAQGLIEHRAHVEAALSTLFVKFADNHFMTVYGDAAPELLDLAETHHMTGHMKWFSFFDGLGSDMSP